MTKGLIVDIYRDGGTDCTNGGATAKGRDALLVHPDIDGPFEESPKRPTLYLLQVARIGGQPQWEAHTSPAVSPHGIPTDGAMFGGNFVFTSDSRFRQLVGGFGYPVPVFDRIER